ncbi:MAG: hypothetical protein ACTHMM_07660 [Agriterribacter sp.]
MKKTLKHAMSLIAVALFFALAIASSPSQRSMTVEKKQIPPDFRGYNGTLLIISQSRQWNRYAEKHFSAHYAGKYQIIKVEDLNKYPKGEKYRFILSPTYYTRTEVGGGHSYTSSEKLCITDRITDKGYCTKSASHFAALLKKYAQALEEERSR